IPLVGSPFQKIIGLWSPWVAQRLLDIFGQVRMALLSPIGDVVALVERCGCTPFEFVLEATQELDELSEVVERDEMLGERVPDRSVDALVRLVEDLGFYSIDRPLELPPTETLAQHVTHARHEHVRFITDEQCLLIDEPARK